MKTGRPSSRPRTDFGHKIHLAREALGLSQAQIAEQLGITQKAYAVWERYPVAIKPDQIEKLINVLQITPEYLFGKNGSWNKRNGPKGKAHKVFEEVSQLPRNRQNRIISVVEDLLAANRL